MGLHHAINQLAQPISTFRAFVAAFAVALLILIVVYIISERLLELARQHGENEASLQYTVFDALEKRIDAANDDDQKESEQAKDSKKNEQEHSQKGIEANTTRRTLDKAHVGSRFSNQPIEVSSDKLNDCVMREREKERRFLCTGVIPATQASEGQSFWESRTDAATLLVVKIPARPRANSSTLSIDGVEYVTGIEWKRNVVSEMTTLVMGVASVLIALVLMLFVVVWRGRERVLGANRQTEAAKRQKAEAEQQAEIEKRKRAEAEAQKEREKQESLKIRQQGYEGLEIYGDMVGRLRLTCERVPHELRDVVAGLILTLEDLDGNGRDDQKAVDTEMLARQLTGVVDKVTEVNSRLRNAYDGGLSPESPEDAEIVDLVNQVIRRRNSMGEGVEVSEICSEKELWVFCRRNSLKEAIDNLVRNADKHGGGVTNITIAQKQSRIWIDVMDQGPGFPAEVRREFDDERPLSERNADRDELESPPTVGRRARMGFGLFWVKSSVKLDLHGKVEILDRQEGEAGTIVRVDFPRQFWEGPLK